MIHTSKKIAKILEILAVAALLTGSILPAALAQTETAEASGTTVETIEIPDADKTLPSDVEKTEAAPGDSEILIKWEKATDNVKVTGYKIYRGTAPVKDTEKEQYDLPMVPVTGGDKTSHTVKNLTNGQRYYFTVTAVDATGNESDNYAPEVSATPKAGLKLPATDDDGKSPQIKEAKAEDLVTLVVVFTEPIKLPEEHPASAFTVQKVSDKSKVDVQKAEIDARDATGMTVVLTTAPQEPNADYSVTAGVEIEDSSGNHVAAGSEDSATFKGGKKKEAVRGAASSDPDAGSAQDAPTDNNLIEDLIPPENVTKLLARIKDAEKNIVELSWTASKNSAGDMIDQTLYQSSDRAGKAYGAGASLGVAAINSDIPNLENGKWYTFKVTTKDASGNESKGAVKSIYLPKTGPGAVAAVMTGLVMGWYSKRKKKNP